MCLKGKCKNHKVEIRSEKEKIKKNWERHLENTVFYMLKINMALTLRSGISYQMQRKKKHEQRHIKENTRHIYIEQQIVQIC